LPGGIDELGVGGDFGCVRRGGALTCWGENDEGQLGNGELGNKRVPVQVGGGLGAGWRSVDLGVDHTCAVTTADELYCWGRNHHGQLGLGHFAPMFAPQPVATGTAWTEAGAGGGHTCARDAMARVWCWGDNDSGQVGTGAAGDHPDPAITSVGMYAQLSLGVDSSSAASSAGLRWVWGRNAEGQLGTGDTMDLGSPTLAMGGPASFFQLAQGVVFGCALGGTGPTGTLWCWGQNTAGQLGQGMTMAPPSYDPTQVGTRTDWTRVTAAYDHACALGAGELWCWGNGYSGQLGVGVNDLYGSPTRVGAGADWTDVETGGLHTCGLRGGDLYCWGAGAQGQLGDGATAQRSTPPPLPVAGGPWADVQAGNHRTCAIGVDGTLWCWGDNRHGAVGDGQGPRWDPTAVLRSP
jgi:alpha-tubulin suppressor-like RCC1 family protein